MRMFAAALALALTLTAYALPVAPRADEGVDPAIIIGAPDDQIVPSAHAPVSRSTVTALPQSTGAPGF
ncbi:hypothetical protein EVG20_g5435 [Dentipellis fragilis]|uniref:Uncharacterized protein n=1 Tax=Dentipellis fragilis TaxID=205917 RepID=A0A4Y9YTB3_9AGAM|nr:hypothetical protein EVG20_g5435 [Dentipellis fragilis]